MFTGIIETRGTIRESHDRGGDRHFVVEATAAFLDGVRPGDSIACNGVCLTAVGIAGARFSADVSIETLGATTARAWGPGRDLNLERALSLGQPLGGHLVSGHVDGVGRLHEKRQDARSWRMRFGAPAELGRYLARKGSITVDGVSLTVNDVDAPRSGGGEVAFDVNIVPHTLQQTTLGLLQAGDPVNLEVDLIARYLERLLAERT